MSPIRSLTLKSSSIDGSSFDTLAGNRVGLGDEIWVLEGEPVLDLLERVDRECKLAMNEPETRAAWAPVEALLNEHGRLT